MSNTGTATGTLTTSSDSSLDTCQITGYIKDISGTAIKAYTFYVRNIQSPLISGTTLIFQERIKLTTDSNGQVRFNLLKDSKFKIEFPDVLSNLARVCTVPDQASAALSDVAFPRVTALSFIDEDLTMNVGDTQSMRIDATMSDGTTAESLSGATIETSNSNVISVSGYLLTAESTGTATISISDYDPDSVEIIDGLYAKKIVRINRITPTYDSITITVS